MTTLIWIVITFLLCAIAGLTVAVVLVRRSLFRKIEENFTFLMDKILSCRYELIKEIHEKQDNKPSFDETMAELLANYSKILEGALKKGDADFIPDAPKPPVPSDLAGKPE